MSMPKRIPSRREFVLKRMNPSVNALGIIANVRAGRSRAVSFQEKDMTLGQIRLLRGAGWKRLQMGETFCWYSPDIELIVTKKK